MKYTKENAVNGYFADVIKKSWTWARLTEEERRRFENLHGLDHIKGPLAAILPTWYYINLPGGQEARNMGKLAKW